MLVRDDDLLIPTEQARAVVGDIVAVQDRVATELWSWRSATFGHLLALLERAIEAGRDSGGTAFAVQTSAPVALPGRSAAFLLWNHLWPLRYRRADAHAAAWAADGLTASEMAVLSPGPRREQIEAETDRRAAPPWERLTGRAPRPTSARFPASDSRRHGRAASNYDDVSGRER